MALDADRALNLHPNINSNHGTTEETKWFVPMFPLVVSAVLG